jgi:hypothetical protein
VSDDRAAGTEVYSLEANELLRRQRHAGRRVGRLRVHDHVAAPLAVFLIVGEARSSPATSTPLLASFNGL